MRDVGREAPLARLGGRERLDLRLERAGHLVERLRPGAELVLAFDRQACLEQALRERMRRRAGPRDRPQGLPCEHGSRERGEEHEHRAADEQDVP